YAAAVFFIFFSFSRPHSNFSLFPYTTLFRSLLIIYFALAYVGATTDQAGFKDGTDILTFNSLLVFGTFGNLIFGVIVILACLTTCIGLVNACSAFAMKKLPKISYKVFVLIFSLLGFLVSTLGLELILEIAVPLLTFIYPT